jgi:hypothetical protein
VRNLRQQEWESRGDFREHTTNSWQAEAASHAYSREHYGRTPGQHDHYGHTKSYYQHASRENYYSSHHAHEGQNYYTHNHSRHGDHQAPNYYNSRHHMRGHSQHGLPDLELTGHHRHHGGVGSGSTNGLHPRAAEMAQLVARHARELGMNQNATVAAVAAMLQESGGDPNKPGDYGRRDHKPHSFGLFQLNFRGGEGTANHLTPQQALDPDINASTALKYFAANQHRTSNPGQLALISQNPSDPNYVSNVNRWVGEARRLLGV